MKDTLELLKKTDFPYLKRSKLDILQVNLGYLCNQQCLHCHVDASPRRTEIMSLETIAYIIEFIKKNNIKTLDLTGGAPELNPHFRYLVTEATNENVHVIDRCNLTILLEPGHEDLDSFLANQQVEIIASMPCYLEENVDNQRGKGVFNKSIEGLHKLNEQGYGLQSDLQLNLVYNPQGENLPPPQVELEQQYKKELKQRFNIDFNNLFTITNMPIKRFGSTLISKGIFESYMLLLKQSHNETNLDSVMCLNMLSVDWLGYVYDCDFNQMLGVHAGLSKDKKHIKDLMTENFKGESITVMDHCYGCTAGAGSSCGGSLT